jgi:uncharacterized OsmC-like protein
MTTGMTTRNERTAQATPGSGAAWTEERGTSDEGRRGPKAPGGEQETEHTNSVIARWEGGWRCRVTASGFDLVVDEPERSGGTGTGPMPTEYLLAAMASCYALALAWAAGKRGITLPGLAVTATGTYDGPRFVRLQLSVESDAPPDMVERLVEPALRVCYVSNTLAASPPIEVSVNSVTTGD